MTRRNLTVSLALVAGTAIAAAIPPLASSNGNAQPPIRHSSPSDFPAYLLAWRAAYPTSTIPDRMAAIGLSTCNLCHEPSSYADPGTCYREDIRTQLNQGLSIQDAIIAVDGLDSDGDGVPNGVEILMVRLDDPTQRGYHPGLIGALGTDPCAINPNAPVSNRLETPPCYADCDPSTGVGILDLFDFLCFQNSFVRGESYACNCDTTTGPLVCDLFDFLCFQGAFVGGCP